MQSNLSSFYSIILFILFSIMTAGNAGTAEIVFNLPITSSGSDLIDIEGSDAYSDSSGLFAAFFTGGSPLASVSFKGSDNSSSSISRDAIYGNHTIDRIKPITAANLADLVRKPGLTKFDRVEINLGGSTAADNIRFNPVPEPASMLLVGTGLIVLAGIGRKKFLNKKISKRS
jgi:hypothetical protein